MKSTFLMGLMLRLVRGDTEQVLLEAIDYLMAESRILKQRYEQDCGRRLLLSDRQRWELATRARPLVDSGYAHVIGIFKPDTLMRWYRRLVASKFDSPGVPRRKPGRPEIPPHVSKLILRFARENRRWGYDRIVGALANLGYEVSDQTVANVLKRHGLEPAPERERNGTWREFIDRHRDVIWATDFLTAEVVTWQGLVTHYVLFFIHLETRRVVLGGITPSPDTQFMQQVARNVTGWDGELGEARYIIHDRDVKFSPFDAVLPESIKPVKLPPRSPNLNAYAERFVCSIKAECLNHFIPLGQRFLRRIIREYLDHYHSERNHQAIDIGNRLLVPDDRASPERTGEVTTHTRLGGLLSFYHRAS
jgi:transposase InsO family protein